MLRHITNVLVAWGPLGILILAIVDSGGIPVAGVFDALLIVIAVERPEVAWLCAGLAVAGSAIGNWLLFATAQHGGRRLIGTPESDGRQTKFRRWFRRFGLITVFVPALFPIPMPLKAFVITAAVLGTPRLKFLTVIVIARAIRYFGVAALGVALGEHSEAFLASHAWQFVVAAVFVFVALYLYVVIRERGRGPESL